MRGRAGLHGIRTCHSSSCEATDRYTFSSRQLTVMGPGEGPNGSSLPRRTALRDPQRYDRLRDSSPRSCRSSQQAVRSMSVVRACGGRATFSRGTAAASSFAGHQTGADAHALAPAPRAFGSRGSGASLQQENRRKTKVTRNSSRDALCEREARARALLLPACWRRSG